MKKFCLFFFCCTCIISCVQPFAITSSAIDSGGLIAKKYTCDGERFSPELAWKDAPAGTKYFVILCIDRTEPLDPIHWFVYNIPVHITKIPEGAGNKKKKSVSLFNTAVMQGKNKYDEFGYTPICPGSDEDEDVVPSLTLLQHHYHFTVYALSEKISIDEKTGHLKESTIKEKMKNLLGTATIIGKYSRDTNRSCCSASRNLN